MDWVLNLGRRRDTLGMSSLSVVLLDVGGTLWSERQFTVPREQLPAERKQRLEATGVSAGQVERLYAELDAHVHGADDLDYFDVWSAVQQACVNAGVVGVSADAVRRAMSLPAKTFMQPLPGVGRLLKTIRELGLGCVIVSNAIWRTQADYWDDLRMFGLGDLVDAVVSSVDTLWRKPNRRFYEIALQAAAAPADACLMVGNSEAKDIVPAVASGMLAVRVAIEDDRPTVSRANFVCDSLEQVGAIVRGIHRDG
jgi:FMN phosphatase YigB (HAD superfamily)